MWKLYRTAKASHSRPSELVEIEDRWAAYQFDNAVIFFGDVVDAASQEQEQVGPENKPQWRAKYHLQQLLDPEFRLPAAEPWQPEEETERDRQMAAIEWLRLMARKTSGGVKVFKGKPA